ncbi:molybdopterin oxidoreductase [Clostridia bacterium]|nr:molybdopterin oxidoreductase [Clostridia bacterium]
MKKSFTCVTCPIGCELTVEYTNASDLTVEGNKCNRGEKYARDEITDPRRTLTSTVPLTLAGGKRGLLPVKTTKAIKKDLLFEAIGIINGIKVNAPVKMGDIIAHDFTEAGVDLIAGRDVI